MAKTKLPLYHHPLSVPVALLSLVMAIVVGVVTVNQNVGVHEVMAGTRRCTLNSTGTRCTGTFDNVKYTCRRINCETAWKSLEGGGNGDRCRRLNTNAYVNNPRAAQVCYWKKVSTFWYGESQCNVQGQWRNNLEFKSRLNMFFSEDSENVVYFDCKQGTSPL